MGITYMHTLSPAPSLACPILHRCTLCRAITLRPQAQACSATTAVVGLDPHTWRLASGCREIRKMSIFWPLPKTSTPTFCALNHPWGTLEPHGKFGDKRPTRSRVSSVQTNKHTHKAPYLYRCLVHIYTVRNKKRK